MNWLIFGEVCQTCGQSVYSESKAVTGSCSAAGKHVAVRNFIFYLNVLQPVLRLHNSWLQNEWLVWKKAKIITAVFCLLLAYTFVEPLKYIVVELKM